jgi:hypothetical protein
MRLGSVRAIPAGLSHRLFRGNRRLLFTCSAPVIPITSESLHPIEKKSEFRSKIQHKVKKK